MLLTCEIFIIYAQEPRLFMFNWMSSQSSFREAVEYSPKCVYAGVYIVTLIYAEFQKSILLWPKERKCDPCISPSVQNNMCLKEYKEHFQNKDLIRPVNSHAVKVNYLAAIDSL